VPAAQRPEVFDRLVASAGGIGRAPARDRRTTTAEESESDDEEGAERFDDVPEEPGHQVLDDVVKSLRRFVAFPVDHQAEAVALWIMHTYGVDVIDTTPRLVVRSPEKRSGKTRLLEIVELLARRTVLAANVSSPALYRLIEATHPTFLIDEADTIFGKVRNGDPRNEDLRGIVNAGHRRGVFAIRCVGEGASITVKRFDVLGPVALAGIGELPDTVEDRAVAIRLRRRRPGDHVESLRRRLHESDARGLARRIAAWVHRHQDELRDHIPTAPAGLTDRALEAWEPLLTVADIAGGTWPARGRKEAVGSRVTRSKTTQPRGCGCSLTSRPSSRRRPTTGCGPPRSSKSSTPSRKHPGPVGTVAAASPPETWPGCSAGSTSSRGMSASVRPTGRATTSQTSKTLGRGIRLTAPNPPLEALQALQALQTRPALPGM
jgi:Protein of unknown function (DUF3631)